MVMSGFLDRCSGNSIDTDVQVEWIHSPWVCWLVPEVLKVGIAMHQLLMSNWRKCQGKTVRLQAEAHGTDCGTEKAQKDKQKLKAERQALFWIILFCHCRKLNEQRGLVSWSVDDLLRRINSNNWQGQLQATQAACKLLSKENIPTTLSALTKAASGSPDQNKAVEGALTASSDLLASPQADINEQTIWTLGNTAGNIAPETNEQIQLVLDAREPRVFPSQLTKKIVPRRKLHGCLISQLPVKIRSSRLTNRIPFPDNVAKKIGEIEKLVAVIEECGRTKLKLFNPQEHICIEDCVRLIEKCFLQKETTIRTKCLQTTFSFL
ncbi:hypothetical protein HPG69_015380 [Diceros bicornis minor]|uniref:Uncharacterized protein n=1 Tax=Diceros bicornis minor TaxID=77932 RepID=A0A7J7F1M1_DICBM|nr:hypothetical protein HPG69_015380 [Diceros bicornis minor]